MKEEPNNEPETRPLDRLAGTSDKSLPTSNVARKIKRFRMKKEETRLGALLPDTIRIGNHMIISRMSNEEFNSKCKILSTKCTSINKSGKECNAHISKQNLEKISAKLRLILKQSENITSDWERKKELHLGNNGYLNLAVNFPEII